MEMNALRKTAHPSVFSRRSRALASWWKKILSLPHQLESHPGGGRNR
jgi:hypothetical protein